LAPFGQNETYNLYFQTPPLFKNRFRATVSKCELFEVQCFGFLVKQQPYLLHRIVFNDNYDLQDLQFNLQAYP